MTRLLAKIWIALRLHWHAARAEALQHRVARHVASLKRLLRRRAGDASPDAP